MTALAVNRWYALALLSLVYGLHSLDRAIVAVVIEPIRTEFALRDATIGMIAGLSHATAFALASIPIGVLVDRVIRVRLLAALLAIWSGFTAFGALAQNYMSLLGLRFLVGAAEAGGAPTCLSLISDLFPPRQRATAVGLLYLSPALGTAASFLVGGLVAAHYGWRAAFLVAGLPGLLLALVVIATFREPMRTEPKTRAKTSDVVRGLRDAFAAPAMRHALLGIALSALVMTSVWTWEASLLIRAHGFTLSQAGTTIALAAGIFQAAGSAASGRLADRIASGALNRLAIVPVGCALVAVPTGLVAVMARDSTIAVGALMMLAFVFTGWIAPSYAVVLELGGPAGRGSTMAALQLVTTLVGAGGGPYLVGTLSDLIGGPDSLRDALAVVMCLNLWVAFHFERMGALARS